MVIETLRKPYEIHKRNEELEERIAELRASLLPGAIRYDKEAVQCSPESNMELTMARILELEDMLAKGLLDYKIAEHDAQRLLVWIKTAEESNILHDYYLEFSSVAEIAKRYHMPTWRVKYLRNKAVRKLEEIMDEV